MPSISASSYSHFHQCNRLYYWQHVVKLNRVKDDGARRFGTLYHAGLNAWWATMDGGDVPWRDKDTALVSALQAVADNAKHINTDPYEVARAEAMLIAYHSRYYELEFETVHKDSTGVEQWFEMPLLDARNRPISGWVVRGRKDVTKRFADGRIKPVESKTTSSDIAFGSDYWGKLAVSMQVSIYIDEAQRSGVVGDEALYDVSRKPGLIPYKATPKDKIKYTKGKGCKTCGGRAGGKGGVAQGTGKVMARVASGGKESDAEIECPACVGHPGWSEAPVLHAKTRLEDETVDDFRRRVADELEEDPNAYFRQCIIKRTPEQIAQSRQNLVVTTGIIGGLTSMALATDGLSSPAARDCFAQNDGACTSIFGRRCDYLDVCSGAVDPFNSHLYAIGKRVIETPVVD